MKSRPADHGVLNNDPGHGHAASTMWTNCLGSDDMSHREKFPRAVCQLASIGNSPDACMPSRPVHLEALDMVLHVIVQREQSPGEVI